MSEEELIQRAAWYVFSNARNREVVMYGYHLRILNSIKNTGIKIEKIFTGNLDLLNRADGRFINEKELAHNSDKYYIILPFFLADGGIEQREKLKKFGYREFKDYVFYPCEINFTETGFGEGNELKEQIELLKKRIAELEKERNQILPNSDLIRWYCRPNTDEDELTAKKRFFKSLPSSTGTHRNMQLAGTILLSKLHSVCKENGLNYWVSFGTLLGAIRHNGFIPWDDDTDVCMMRADIMRLTEILKDDPDFYVSHIFAEFKDNLNHCVQLKYRKGAPYCLDIFIYDYCKKLNKDITDQQAMFNDLLAEEAQSIIIQQIPKEEKNKQYDALLQKYLKMSRLEVGTTDEPTDYMIWALDNYRCSESFQGNCALSDIFPLTTVMFEGLEFFAPHTAEEYLKKKYGDIYSLPRDILSHTHFRLSTEDEKKLNEILEQYGSYLN